MKQELDLKVCPFCSGVARIISESGTTEPKRCFIRCSICGARTETVTAETGSGYDFKKDNAVPFDNSKTEQLAELGITEKQKQRYEKLASRNTTAMQ